MQPGPSEDESPGLKQVNETQTKHVQSREPISKTPYMSAFDDPSSSNSPLLSPVLEKSSSSIFEGNDF